VVSFPQVSPPKPSKKTLYYMNNKLQGFQRFLGSFHIFIASIS
jgi:hypothetical protein